MVTGNEFSHELKISELGGKTRSIHLSADPVSRTALAKRFDLATLDMLEADITVTTDGAEILATGQITAKLEQICVATRDPIAVNVSEQISIRFIPEPHIDEETEFELAAEDCDVMFHDGQLIDLGEAVAQSLGLALDPYPRSSNADTVLKAAGVKDEDESGPFSVLAALREKLAKK
ncbi:MAG: YceD family protein [Sphingorhabdus sp.]|uniref:YceD family protein n=1 Tax=Sphingorhabdus sp. TaxID=1902408 RepID=UPI0038FC748D